MANRIVSIAFHEQDYAHLSAQATEAGLSVAQYIKGKVVTNAVFDHWFAELLRRIDALQPGARFNVKMIFSTDWAEIDRGIRLSIARNFYNYVRTGKLQTVVVGEKDSSKIQWYDVV